MDYDADKSDIKALAAVVKEAERLGMWVMLDMHDYCERNIDGVLYEYGVAGRKVWNSSKNSWGDWEAMSEVILTKEHFADLWKKIATEFKDYTNIWGYDLMNEPKGIDINILFDDYQALRNRTRMSITRRNWQSLSARPSSPASSGISRARNTGYGHIPSARPTASVRFTVSSSRSSAASASCITTARVTRRRMPVSGLCARSS